MPACMYVFSVYRYIMCMCRCRCTYEYTYVTYTSTCSCIRECACICACACAGICACACMCACVLILQSFSDQRIKGYRQATRGRFSKLLGLFWKRAIQLQNIFSKRAIQLPNIFRKRSIPKQGSLSKSPSDFGSLLHILLIATPYDCFHWKYFPPKIANTKKSDSSVQIQDWSNAM